MTIRLNRPALVSTLAVGALTLSLAACAGMGAREGTYAQKLDALADSCEARGGMLVPTGGQSASPERDYVCEIRGLPSSRTR